LTTRVSDGVALFRSVASAIRSIRHLVSATVFQTLVAALVFSQLDYDVGWSSSLPHPSTSVGSECSGTTHIPAPCSDFRPHHISDGLVSLHSILSAGKDRPQAQGRRVLCRLISRCKLMLRCIFSSSHAPLTSRLDKDLGRSSTTDSLFLLSDFLLLNVVPVLTLVHVYGTTLLFTVSAYIYKQRLRLHISLSLSALSLLPRSYLSTVPPLLWSLK